MTYLLHCRDTLRPRESIDMPVSDQYISFFLDCPSAIVKVECLELSHPSFSQIYRIVRNVTAGIEVMHDDGVWYPYVYYPLRIRQQAIASDLDYGIEVDLGDLGTIVPVELKRIRDAGTNDIEISVIYRVYRSDVLNLPMEGPHYLKVHSISYNREGCSFEASASTANANKTGEPYDLIRFYPLRGFLY